MINYGTISASGADEVDAAIMAYEKLISPHIDRYLPWIEDRVQSHEYLIGSQPEALRDGLQITADHPYEGSTDIVLSYRNQSHQFYLRVLPLSFKDMKVLRDIGQRIMDETGEDGE
ncbi:MAG: hypothetical protein QM811_13550 [Pirellulales bacterium]